MSNSDRGNIAYQGNGVIPTDIVAVSVSQVSNLNGEKMHTENPCDQSKYNQSPSPEVKTMLHGTQNPKEKAEWYGSVSPDERSLPRACECPITKNSSTPGELSASLNNNDDADLNSPVNSSIFPLNETNRSLGIHHESLTHIQTSQVALDLSMKSCVIPESCCSESLDLHCCLCGQMSHSIQELHAHFDSKHNEGGAYWCYCGEKFDWLPQLFIHRDHCSVPISLLKKESEKKIGYLYSGADRNILDTSEVPQNARGLICTACGKSGFHDAFAYFTHVTTCSQQTFMEKAHDLRYLNHHRFSPVKFVPHQKKSQASLNESVKKMITFDTARSNSTTGLNKSFFEYPLPCFPLEQTSTEPDCFGYSKSYTYSPSHSHPVYSTAQSHSQALELMKGRDYSGKDPEKLSINIQCRKAEETNGLTDISRPFKCSHCIKAFKSKALLDQHMHIHFPPKYTCRYCAKKYRWPPVFYHHQRTCKKRPPVTTSSTFGSNSTTTPSFNNMHMRNGPITSDSRPSQEKCTSSAAKRTQTNTTASKFEYPASRGLPFYPPPIGIMTDYFRTKELTDPTAAETMGLAALATAMLIRFPLLQPIPPPLGLCAPYSTMSQANHIQPKISPNNRHGVISTEMHQLIPSQRVLQAPQSNLVSTEESVGTTKSEYILAGMEQTSRNENSVENLCACGMKCENVWKYFNHIASCNSLPMRSGIMGSLFGQWAQGAHMNLHQNASVQHSSNSDIADHESPSVHCGGNSHLRDGTGESVLIEYSDFLPSKRKMTLEKQPLNEVKKFRTSNDSISLSSQEGISCHRQIKSMAAIGAKYETESEVNDAKIQIKDGKAAPPKDMNADYLNDQIFSSDASSQSLNSNSLMEAMASVLATAAAAAGFHCSEQTASNVAHEDFSEGKHDFPTYNLAPLRSCVQCGKEFSSRLSLKQHVEGKHSAEGKYQCPGCLKRYRWGASYYYHKKSCSAMRETSPASLDSAISTNEETNRSSALAPFPNREYILKKTRMGNIAMPVRSQLSSDPLYGDGKTQSVLQPDYCKSPDSERISHTSAEFAGYVNGPESPLRELRNVTEPLPIQAVPDETTPN